MIDIVLAVLVLVTLLVSSYTDLKKREVPDWISHSLIFAALGIRLLYSVFNKEFTTFVSGLLGFGVFFLVSYALYYAKQWGGGDAKLLMGMGAVLGLTMKLLVFVLLLIFVGALYGLGWSIFLAFKNKNKFKKSFVEHYYGFGYLAKTAIGFLIIGILGLFVIPDFAFAFFLFGIAAVFFIGIFSFLFTKSVEESCLYQRLKASQLTEGDWVAETIKIKGKTIITEDNLGITKEQIQKLKHYKKLILVKLGIPFVPTFLLAFLVLLLAQNWVLSLI